MFKIPNNEQIFLLIFHLGCMFYNYPSPDKELIKEINEKPDIKMAFMSMMSACTVNYTHSHTCQHNDT